MRIALRAALLGVAILLSSCGGGGGDVADAGAGPGPGPGPGPGQAPQLPVLSGVVAIGAPLPGEPVTSICSNGTAGPSTTTDAQGIYRIEMPTTCPGPWLVQVIPTFVGRVTRLYGWGGERPVFDAYGNLVPNANVTTATTLLARAMFDAAGWVPQGDSYADLMQAWRDLDWEQHRPLLEEALAALQQRRPAGSPPLTLAAVLHALFHPAPGDPVDDLLEYLADNAGTVTPAALVEQVRKQGGNLADGTPWKTLFAPGSDTLTLSATECPVFGGAPVPGTVTLRMQGQDLQVDVATAAMTPFSFTTGPATTRGEFQMIVRGNAPYVRMTASARVSSITRRIELFVQDDVPRIALTHGGITTSCVLATPVRRADLVAFHPAARVLSALPAEGAAGNCNAVGATPAYTYAITRMGDVRFDGASLPAGWLDTELGYYSESLQYNMFGSAKAFQVQLSASATQQGVQPYVFTGGAGVNCTNFNF